MVTDEMSLDFLKTKIYQIRTAIISNEEKINFGFPTCIVSALSVDDRGNIWFLMDGNGRFLNNENSLFPVNLRFYRKGYYFALNINGLASITSNTALVKRMMRVTEEEGEINLGSACMVKVKIQNANCYEWEPKPYRSWLQFSIQKWFSWFHFIKPSAANSLPEYSIS